MINKLILAALMPALVSCAYIGGVRASENIVEKNVSVADFHALKVSGAISAIYTCDSVTGVYVSAPDNVMPWIVVECADGTLDVHMKHGHPNFSGRMHVQVTASSPVLSYAEISGASSFTANGLVAGSFDLSVSGASEAVVSGLRAPEIMLRASGASELSISDVSGRNVSAEASGASEIFLSGVCDAAVLSASGASEIAASGLSANSVSKSASGASEVTAQ